MAKVPERLRWAVDVLQVQPHQHLLEIGCGAGVAAGLIADRLTTGWLTAIDRSATAIERATKRNTDHLSAGRLELVMTDLASFRPHGASFDTVLAMNVNLFWTTPADKEWQVLADSIVPGGSLFLFYGYGPGDPTNGRDLDAVLNERGYLATVEAAPDGSSSCFRGRRST